MAQDDSKPDETASSALGPPSASDQDVDTEVTRSGSVAATGSHKPTAPSPAPKGEAEEYMLEREPDGRYRITGRQPRRRE